jgi:DUF218 domain-containing protein
VIELFFSYSQADRDFTEVYLDALVRSGVISRDEVFCFERPGAQGTTGQVIGDNIRTALGAPMAIAIISRDYLASSYCVGEFGYLRFSRGIGGGVLAPILMPPLTSATVPQFFRDVGLLEEYAAASTLNALLDMTARSLKRITNHEVWERVRDEAAERLRAVATSRPAPSAPIVDLCDLPEATLRKILAVRGSRLSRREQEWFYARFQELEPRYHVPSSPVAHGDLQSRLEAARPLDDDVILGLGDAFGVVLPKLTRPISESVKSGIQAVVTPLADAIFADVRQGGALPRAETAKARAFRRLYDYLCADEILATRDTVTDSNVIVVPGARRGHVFRADEAARVARLSPSLSMVLFSGGHPIYDDEQDLPFGEADALACRFLQQYSSVPEHVAVLTDGRARTTAETIAHLRLHLGPLVARIGSPVTVTLITSPYHMRRLYYLADESLFPSLAHLVKTVQGSLSNASFDWGVIAQPRAAADLALAKYGIRVYVEELAKLYGGRATGEF